DAAVGQNDYQLWQFREEFEYGVTDNYTVSLYVNHDYEFFRDNAGVKNSRYDWTGLSLENKYMVLNPAEHAVGLTLYLEPNYDGDPDGNSSIELEGHERLNIRLLFGYSF